MHYSLLTLDSDFVHLVFDADIVEEVLAFAAFPDEPPLAVFCVDAYDASSPPYPPLRGYSNLFCVAAVIFRGADLCVVDFLYFAPPYLESAMEALSLM
jgi:hypothetical protein